MSGVQSINQQHVAAWLGAGALTMGVGAAALAFGSGVANADTAGPGTTSRHTVSAVHAPRGASKPIAAAHAAPRHTASPALIAASTITGVVTPARKSSSAAAPRRVAVVSSSPPDPVERPSTAQKAATPTANINIGDVIQTVFSGITSAIQSVLSPINGAINTTIVLIETILSGNVADIYAIGFLILARILGVPFI